MYDDENPRFLMVTSINADKLGDLVNERLSEGYVLHGIPMLDPRGPKESSIWAQAMVKKDDRRRTAGR